MDRALLFGPPCHSTRHGKRRLLFCWLVSGNGKLSSGWLARHLKHAVREEASWTLVAGVQAVSKSMLFSRKRRLQDGLLHPCVPRIQISGPLLLDAQDRASAKRYVQR